MAGMCHHAWLVFSVIKYLLHTKRVLSLTWTTEFYTTCTYAGLFNRTMFPLPLSLFCPPSTWTCLFFSLRGIFLVAVPPSAGVFVIHLYRFCFVFFSYKHSFVQASFPGASWSYHRKLIAQLGWLLANGKGIIKHSHFNYCQSCFEFLILTSSHGSPQSSSSICFSPIERELEYQEF